MTEPVAYPLLEFIERYGIGKTKAYQEIKAGRLVAIKSGRSTLITAEAAKAWLNSLPALELAA